MPNRSVSLPPQRTRKQSAEEINRAMSRFPLILQILGELNREQFPCPGDDDIRHGCERALTGMLCELSRIPVAPAGKACKAEEAAHSWLRDKSASNLVDADLLQRMQEFIENILNQAED